MLRGVDSSTPPSAPTTDRWFAPLSDLKTRGDRVDLHVSREDPLLVPVADGQGAAARQRGPAPDRLHPGGFPEVSDGESALEEFREIVRRAGR